MAPKSKSKPKAIKNAPEPLPERTATEAQPLAKIIGSVALTLGLTAISSPVSQLSLGPVYGSIPSYQYHQQAIVFTTLVAFIARPNVEHRLPANLQNYIPVLAYYIPVIQFVLFKFSTFFGPFYGPLVTEFLTYFPLLMLSALTSARLLATLKSANESRLMGELIPAVGPYMYYSFSEKLATVSLPRLMGRSAFFTRVSLQLLIASAFSALNPSKLILLAIPAMIHTARVNPHYESAHTTALLNTTLQSYNWTLIDRKESLTGYVSVLESSEHEFRILRCDHSLLGGEWLLTPERRAQGQMVTEPIYQVFTMLEAVRLVETPEKRPDSDKSALVIGLGIGTAPKALIEHGINTTIVELDPVVHYFASKYFALPNNHTVALVNALSFVNEVAPTHPASYDYIIHDVFTGGAEPASLFTIEFLAGLHTLLRENGVIAINYAGDLALSSTKLVLATINNVFPSCRIFRDNPPDPSSPHAEFVNMVVFCTKAAADASAPLTFRKPVKADFAGSVSRERFLPPKSSLEIKWEEVLVQGEETSERQLLRKGKEYQLEKHHGKSAADHWKIMRGVVPAAVWENW